ncbi:MAG: hypothetical protein FJ134_06460 [Deltaproteobacteria bacterium]|nr:hypothetical protein [Deltaproteobacteria bacterium]
MNRSFLRVLVFSLVFLWVLWGFVSAPRAQLTDERYLIPLVDIDLPGWEKKKGFPNIEKGTEADKGWVETQMAYERAGSSLTAVITEGGELSKDLATIGALPEYNNQDGYRKKINIKGFSGVEIYDKSQKKGTVVLNIANRFGLKVEGVKIEDNAVLKEFINKMALHKLWRMAQ